MTDHVIVYGRGSQSLRTVPLDRMGRPVVVSSPTYGIDDISLLDGDSQRVVVAHGTSATVDSTTTTLSAAAGAGQADARRLQVVSSTGFVAGRRYVVKKADGATELFEAERIDATNVYSRHALRRAWASSDTVRGVEVTGSFPAGTVDDEEHVKDGGGPYRLQWRWNEAGGLPEQIDELVWVRRSSKTPLCNSADLLRRWPSAANWARNDISIDDALQSAHDDYHARLLAARVDTSYYFTGPVGSVAVIARALYYLHMWRNTDDSRSIAETFREEWQQHLDALRFGEPGQRTATVNANEDVAPRGPDRTARNPFILT